MGWLFTRDSTRKEQIRELTCNWERTNPDGILVKANCLASCYRGGSFSGVLWSVWELTYERAGGLVQPKRRWITCDLLRYQSGHGWGYKDMSESMGPGYFSCPLKYLEMVPVDRFGGNSAWRDNVLEYHAAQREARRARREARSGCARTAVA